MNARLDHSPINVGKVLPNHPLTFTPVLEPARAQPCYEGADDVGDWACSQAEKYVARKAELDAESVADMRHVLERLFIVGMENAALAASTARVPVTVRFNAAAEHEARDRWAYRVYMEPVTTLACTLLETRGGSDDHLRLMIAPAGQLVAERTRQLAELAKEYAESEAANLVAAGWLEGAKV